MDPFDNLKVQQLDSALEPFRPLRRALPAGGWAKTIREALGMSLRQYAKRMGVSKTAANSAEQSEARGTVQLDTLQQLADALGCDLVYALVPRDSLRSTLERQAEAIATQLVGRVSSSMELEDQGIPHAERRRQIEELTREVLEERPSDFWDV